MTQFAFESLIYALNFQHRNKKQHTVLAFPMYLILFSAWTGYTARQRRILLHPIPTDLVFGIDVLLLVAFLSCLCFSSRSSVLSFPSEKKK